ncbi:hypothetical protein CH330_01140 [candidate division WOR-3 bacterium JGI_Cruoil_03_51_56]|uniref:Urease accessory protein UreH-like transmembrane domain-containing protein n=1 Tax=candidate division WOR-3 bacterium JGI_Cruoil_03_51_56 TaxID=1973747 RepID=A0A235BXD9_UNCW3|nr:MAG: hypothetical protein CH330_01140 [candidate division WOR-3 bacterium JGI_Cruoil_03_51_56]
MLNIISKALVLGFSSGLFCIGFCVPLVGPMLLSRSRSGLKESAAAFGLFLVGRLIAYLLFGLVFGMLGSILEPVWAAKSIAVPILYAILGILMILYGFVQSFHHIGFCRILNPKFQSHWYFLLIGFLAGINFCPPFLLAITTAFDLGGPLKGMLFFFVFFLATTIYLAPLLFTGLVNRFKQVRFAARIASIIAGLYFISLAARTIR